MNTLRDSQRAFLDSLLADGGGAEGNEFLSAAVPVATALAIYRNNAFATLGEALGGLYPVVRQLVGNGFFAFAVNSYIKSHPPRSPVLGESGDEFPVFLETFAPASSVPYLGDVARLELARYQALVAADATPLDAAAFDGIQPERFGALRLRLHPSCRLVRSPWPVEAIRAAHDDGAEPEEAVDFPNGETCLLVGRPESKVETVTLTPAVFDMVARLGAGATLADAFAATGGDWDPQGALTFLLVFGAFVDFNLEEGTA